MFPAVQLGLKECGLMKEGEKVKKKKLMRVLLCIERSLRSSSDFLCVRKI